MKAKVCGLGMVKPLGILYYLESYEFHFLTHVKFNFTLIYDTKL